MRRADVVLLCCPVKDLQTLDLPVLAKKLRVFKEGAEKESVVLVGTKSDLKDDGNETRGGIVAKELGLQCFLECSSTSMNSVRDLIRTVIDTSNNTTGESKPNTDSMFLSVFISRRNKEGRDINFRNITRQLGLLERFEFTEQL